MRPPNYDLSSLHLEVDLRGWVLAESALGTAELGETGGDWTDILGDFLSIEATTSVAVDSGALFRPEASELRVTTRTLARLDDVYNRTIRLRYGTTILAVATVKEATIDASPNPEHIDETYLLHITAIGAASSLNRALFSDLSAPEETVTDRISRIYPAAVCSALPGRLMPAIGPVSADVLTLLQEAADVAGVLFIVDELNRVQLAAGHFPYRGGAALSYDFDSSNMTGLRLGKSIDSIVTAWLVTAKSDDTVSVLVRATGAVVGNQKAITVDCVPTVSAVTVIAESLPKATTPATAPTGLDVGVDLVGVTTVDRPRLLDTVSVLLDGATYSGAVTAVRDQITPTKWATSLDLAPASILTRTPVPTAPGAPRSLRTSARTASTVTLAWNAPMALGDATGFVVRRAAGTVPPTSPTDGTSVGGGTLSIDTLSVVDTGLTSMRDYAYALFAVTADPDIYSPIVTLASWTIPVLPTPVVTVSGSGTYTVTVDWTATTYDAYDWAITLKVVQGMVTVFDGPTTATAADREVIAGGIGSHGPATATATVQARRTWHGIAYTGTKTTEISSVTL